MKKLRFLIAIVLIFSLLPVFGVSATEQADEVTITETSEFKKLEAFGLINEDDTILYYDTVMRSSFIAHIMKCYPGYSEATMADGFENPFSDVGEGVKEANAIAAAAKVGLISGAKGSEFRPFDKITKSEAAKVFVTMLGYQEYAEMKGGYPSGYLAMAQSLNLFDGCEFTSEGLFTVNGFLKAYLNALETEVLEVRSVTLNAAGEFVTQSYKALEERTLLYYTFGIYEAKGIVEADEYTAVTGKSSLGRNQVKINGYEYDAKETNASLLIGYNTQYYYKKAKDAIYGELVYIEPFRNNVASTYTENIENSHVSKTNFRYYEDAKSNKYYDLKLSKSVSLIHNGEQKALTSENVKLLQPVNGTVTLVDNNDDNVYDVIFVTDYRTIVVATASNGTYQITDALGGSTITLDPNADEYGVSLYIEQPVTDNTRYEPAKGLYGSYLPQVENVFSSIKSGDVVLYAESSSSNNRAIKFVKVSRTVVEGTVKSISKNLVTINDKEYQVGPIMAEEAKKDAQGNIQYTIKKKDFKVALGEYGKFYLDAFGRIVGKSLQTDVAYGFLNGIGEEKDAFSSAYRVQIFTENGNWVVLDLADNVKTNVTAEGTAVFKTLKADKVYAAILSLDNGCFGVEFDDKGNVTKYGYQQLVTYTVNSAGKVSSIAIAHEVDAYENNEQEATKQNLFRRVKYTGCGATSRLTKSYNAEYAAFGYEILADSGTRFFVIPEKNDGSQDGFYIESVDYLANAKATFIPYDVSEDRLANAVVMIGRSRGIMTKTPMFIVEETITTIDESGEIRDAITGFYKGQPLTLIVAENCEYVQTKAVTTSTTTEEALASPLVKGDVVSIAIDSNGELSKVRRECGASEDKQKILYAPDANRHNGATTVYHVNSLKSRVVLDTAKQGEKGVVKANKNTTYYVYDSQKGTVSEGTFADIEIGSFIFTRLNNELLDEVLIYR